MPLISSAPGIMTFRLEPRELRDYQRSQQVALKDRISPALFSMIEAANSTKRNSQA